MTITPTYSDDIYQYLVNHSLQESALLQRLKAETLNLPGGQMMAAPEQAQFIALLIKLINAQRVIEIGTFTGYTTLAMALALPDRGRVLTCDISEKAPQLGQRYWCEAGVADKVELAIIHGLTLLDELVIQGGENNFDLAFIDADKKNNHAYYEKLLTLIRPNGLIIIDNVLWKGRMLEEGVLDANTQAIDQFNAFIHQDDRVEISMVPLGDGLTLARKC